MSRFRSTIGVQRKDNDLYQEWETFSCYVCRAKPRERCKTPRGAVANKPHASRRDQWVGNKRMPAVTGRTHA